MDATETRSPLQTKNPNIMASKLRPPSAIKRPYVKELNDDGINPKMKVPKCDLSVTSKPTTVQSTLRRQTATAVVRRQTSTPALRKPTTKPSMPPPSSAPRTTTMRRQTSATQVKKGPTTTARNMSGTKTNASGARTTMSSARTATAAKTTQGAGSKRAKWDYKGRLEDMEKMVANNNQFMNNMNDSLNNNKERIEYLMSINQELEQANEVKSQRNEESSAIIFDLQSQTRSLQEEIESLKRKHEFEIEVNENKCKNLDKQLKQVEGDLTVSREETNALRSTIATMTAQSYGIRTELEATKLNLQNALSTCEQKEKTIQEQLQKIQELEQLINEKDSKLMEEETVRRKLHNTIQELKGNIRVFCRVRPPLQAEKNSTLANFTFNEDQKVTVEQAVASEDVTGSKRALSSYDFNFDKIFNQSSSQDNVFEEISQLVQSALDGYNVCIFAYGQTGSGKTYTMEGDHGDFEKRGMIPRSMEHVFVTSNQLRERGWKYEMKASFLEIYNENIRDLLGSDDTLKYEIKMVNNGKNSSDAEVMVTNLKIVEVVDEQQVFSLLKTAAQNRAVGATKCNERSSRSHSVFILKLSGENSLTGERCQGTLNLIDLAGSERLSQSGAEGKRLKETKNINSSLSNLSNVIMALANKESHIPYRNSKLTYLLKNSLGGNSKSLMFVNVSPREDSFQETLCSLRFATKVNQCNIGTAQKKVVK